MTERTTGLRRDAIGTSHIVFFVVAAAAPLTAVVGVSTAAFSFGNGAGVPAVFLLVGAFYLLFSVGFTAMSRFVVSSSGFYAYVVQGLGRPAGAGAAAIALASYQAIAMAAYGLFGFFAHTMAKQHFAIDWPWWTFAVLVAVLVHICGRRAITFSGNLLAICMMLEVCILLLLGASILHHYGIGSSIEISLRTAFDPGFGISLVFIVASFIGFEATVIFGEEARDPAKTIPRATYVAVLLIALFYAFCSWTILIYYGASHIHDAATLHPDDLYLAAISVMLGGTARTLTDGLLLMSIFAGILSFHAAISRYLAAMAREGLCPSRLSSIHSVYQSPHVAGIVQTVATLGMLALCAALHADPYTGIFAIGGAFASLGVLAVQLLTSAAVIGFFGRDGRNVPLVRRLLAPAASVCGLAVALVLSTINLPLLSGISSPALYIVPIVVAGIGIGGVATALRLRHRAPEIYRRMGFAVLG